MTTVDVRVAAYGVIVRDGEILLSHWSQSGMSGWTLPGGGLEGDETPEQAAVREIFEETGYTAELGDLLGVDEILIPPAQRLHITDRSFRGIRHIFLATITGGTLTNEIDGSSDEARWFDLAAIDTVDTVELVDAALTLWREKGPPKRASS